MSVTHELVRSTFCGDMLLDLKDRDELDPCRCTTLVVVLVRMCHAVG